MGKPSRSSRGPALLHACFLPLDGAELTLGDAGNTGRGLPPRHPRYPACCLRICTSPFKRRLLSSNAIPSSTRKFLRTSSRRSTALGRPHGWVPRVGIDARQAGGSLPPAEAGGVPVPPVNGPRDHRVSLVLLPGPTAKAARMPCTHFLPDRLPSVGRSLRPTGCCQRGELENAVRRMRAGGTGGGRRLSDQEGDAWLLPAPENALRGSRGSADVGPAEERTA